MIVDVQISLPLPILQAPSVTIVLGLRQLEGTDGFYEQSDEHLFIRNWSLCIVVV